MQHRPGSEAIPDANIVTSSGTAGAVMVDHAGQTKEVRASRQFGQGPWPWVGLTLEDQHLAVDQMGNRYMLYSYTIKDYDNWKVIHLRNLVVVSESMMRVPRIGTR